MMSFGWRPQSSCYSAKDQDIPVQQQNCQSPTWWYLLMAGALAAGLWSGKKKKATA